MREQQHHQNQPARILDAGAQGKLNFAVEYHRVRAMKNLLLPIRDRQAESSEARSTFPNSCGVHSQGLAHATAEDGLHLFFKVGVCVAEWGRHHSPFISLSFPVNGGHVLSFHFIPFHFVFISWHIPFFSHCSFHFL